MESLFAEYQKELLEEYDLFGLDGTYETGNYSEERVLNRITVYGAVAGESQVEAVRFLGDGEGREFADQVCRYMENRFGIDIIKDLTGKEDEAKKQEEEAEKYQQRKRRQKRRWMRFWHLTGHRKALPKEAGRRRKIRWGFCRS